MLFGPGNVACVCVCVSYTCVCKYVCVCACVCMYIVCLRINKCLHVSPWHMSNLNCLFHAYLYVWEFPAHTYARLEARRHTHTIFPTRKISHLYSGHFRHLFERPSIPYDCRHLRHLIEQPNTCVANSISQSFSPSNHQTRLFFRTLPQRIYDF